MPHERSHDFSRLLCPHPAHVPRRPRHGLHRPRPRRHAAPTTASSGRRAARRDAAGRPAALRAEGEVGHLDLPLRRLQPRRDLRPQAGPEPATPARPSTRRRSRTRSSRRCTRSGSARSPAEEINVRDVYPIIYPDAGRLQESTAQSGIEITDWWPHLATLRRRHRASSATCGRPTTTTPPRTRSTPAGTASTRRSRAIGSWVHYGLGTLNENLPQFVVLGGPTRTDTRPVDRRLLPRPAARRRPARPRPDATRCPSAAAARRASPSEQRNEYELIGRLNELAAVEYPDDQALRARIRAYELAFRMQTAVPEALDLRAGDRGDATALRPRPATPRASPASGCWPPGGWSSAACASCRSTRRRTASWDSHQKLRDNHARLCADDRPAGRRPAQGPEAARPARTTSWSSSAPSSAARPAWSSAAAARTAATTTRTASRSGWPAPGSRSGHVHGATDELGFHALGEGHYVTDLHATVLHLLGLDNRRLEVPGRSRLEIDHGRPIEDILA